MSGVSMSDDYTEIDTRSAELDFLKYNGVATPTKEPHWLFKHLFNEDGTLKPTTHKPSSQHHCEEVSVEPCQQK